MKIYIKYIFNFIIRVIPAQLACLILRFLKHNKILNKSNWSIKDRIEFYLWVQIRNWPIKKVAKLNKLIKRYQLVSILELPGTKEISRIRGGVFTNYSPKVLGICDGGEIKYDFEDEIFYELSDVSFNIESDFIRKDEFVVCEKLYRKDSSILTLEDFDFIKKQGNNIFLIERSNSIYLENVFFMTGILSGFWSHFLICFYPRLAYLESINTDEISIVIPYKLDTNIKQLIEENILDQGRIKIIEVDHDTTVFCKKLFYAKINSYILCHSNHSSPYTIQISKQTSQFLFAKFSKLAPKKHLPFRKLFISRTGLRNIQNYSEILSYFMSLGFEEVIPHKLSIDEKRKLFGEAKWIVGPLSSGFTNIIFCNPGVQILAFTNVSRCFDPYLSTLCEIFDGKILFITGSDVNSDINSDYFINISEVKKFMDNLKNINIS